MKRPPCIARITLTALCFIWLSMTAWPVNSAPGASEPDSGATADASRPAPAVRHDVTVVADPGSRTIDVRDTITLPKIPSSGTLHLALHRNLAIRPDPEAKASPPGFTIEILDDTIPGETFGVDATDMHDYFPVPVAFYRITFAPDSAPAGLPRTLTLAYSGVIDHPIEQLASEYERSFSTTPGIVSGDGIVLSGSSVWIPWFGPDLFTFSLAVDLPSSWLAVSQGRRTAVETGTARTISRWDCPHPMEEIYLIAAPFSEYSKTVSGVTVMAFLRSPDAGLATKYLDVTGQYLDLYNNLIGAYPFEKFALIENFWETGYGMPSFTLLGPTVIRLPFILHSSYPHELLHNWWGNSVYVDYRTGNWCEGLTAYLADHLIKEQRGQGAEYRRGTLQKYSDYVNAGNDFPISEFTSRIHAPSEAVGYGKSLMMFHMMRRAMGGNVFGQFLQAFYRDFRFRHASFDDIRTTASAVTGTDWSDFVAQWVTRPGAPRLALSGCRNSRNPETGTMAVEFTIEQVQQEPVWSLQVPVALTFKDRPDAEWRTVTMENKRQSFSLETDGPVARLDIDPEFDLFRRLDKTEIPPALSAIFGSENATIVLDESEASEAVAAAYRGLAESWAAGSEGRMQVTTTDKLTELPPGAVWLFGRNNRLAGGLLAGLERNGVRLTVEEIMVETSTMPVSGHAFVFTVHHPEHPDQTVAWLFTDVPESLAGLGRKLPHYGKYSYLVFEGTEPGNILSGQWAPTGSPLTAAVEPASAEMPPIGKLPNRPVLASLPPAFDTERMMNHIRYLAGPDLAGRGLGSPELDSAADYIARQFEAAGLRPGGDDGSWFQEWSRPATGDQPPMVLKNVIGIRPGDNPVLAAKPVILCAHYDHLGRDPKTGAWFPGADDNASGVAVLCELAACLPDTLDRDIRFIAFTGEETGRLGSRHFVTASEGYPVRDTIAAINLDSVGRFDGRHFLVLGSGSAREWAHLFMGCSHATGVATRMVTEPLDSSDQESFIEAGIPAVQIFSGPHRDYHAPSDTADRINPEGLARAAALVKEAALYLADRPDPLTATGVSASSGSSPAGSPSSAHPPGPGRTVGTGSMPDFTFEGPGVRLADVAPGSPADAAGLRKDDVLIRLDDNEIRDLRSYTELLKQHRPGDKVPVEYMRNGQTCKTEIVLGQKSYN